MKHSLLSVNDLSVNYGPIVALTGLSLNVNEGEIVTLVGANGAGKSTLLNTIMGIVRSHSGEIIYDGKDITRSDTMKIVKSGLILAPEGRQVFGELTVEGNLEMGGFNILKAQAESCQEEVYELFPRLRERKHQFAATLSGGEQQMLAIGRGLMAKPRLLMLDEPSLGLSPILVKEILKTIKKIRATGTSVLLIEQNAKMALSVSDRGYVIENGANKFTGTGKELLNNANVQKAYLGG